MNYIIYISLFLVFVGILIGLKVGIRRGIAIESESNENERWEIMKGQEWFKVNK